MRIIAKSAPVVEHMRDKISKGCDGIEIQLMDDFLDESNDEIQYVENILQVKDIDVKIIHLPILKGEDLNLELFSYPLYKDCFLKAVRLANILGEYFEHKIIIVIHNGFSFEQYIKIPMLFDFTKKLFRECIEKYKNVEYAFENVLPFVFDDEKFPRTRNGFLYDNIDLANYFNNEFETKAFGTVVDTCHIMTSERVLKRLFEKDYNDVISHISLKIFLERNKDVVKIFHLANVENLGYNKLEHGTVFSKNEKDSKFLEEFFDLYYKYGNDAYITIEVFEFDYLDAKNYLNTKNIVQKYIREC